MHFTNALMQKAYNCAEVFIPTCRFTPVIVNSFRVMHFTNALMQKAYNRTEAFLLTCCSSLMIVNSFRVTHFTNALMQKAYNRTEAFSLTCCSTLMIVNSFRVLHLSLQHISDLKRQVYGVKALRACAYFFLTPSQDWTSSQYLQGKA
jgi:hypothetical protein